MYKAFKILWMKSSATANTWAMLIINKHEHGDFYYPPPPNKLN